MRAVAGGAPETMPATKTEVVRRMIDFAGTERLRFFLEVSVDPVAAELAGLHRPAWPPAGGAARPPARRPTRQPCAPSGTRVRGGRTRAFR